MSLLNFSNVQYIKSIDTGESVRCGAFQVTESAELAYIRNFIYVRGNLGGNERCRTRIYADALHERLLYTSDWSAKLSTAFSGNWLGFIRTDFNKENFNANSTYYLQFELDGYTRNGESFYIGTCRDFPYPIYKITPTPTKFYRHPQAAQIFVWYER